jgi:hypothetical protein
MVRFSLRTLLLVLLVACGAWVIVRGLIPASSYRYSSATAFPAPEGYELMTTLGEAEGPFRTAGTTRFGPGAARYYESGRRVRTKYGLPEGELWLQHLKNPKGDEVTLVYVRTEDESDTGTCGTD